MPRTLGPWSFRVRLLALQLTLFVMFHLVLDRKKIMLNHVGTEQLETNRLILRQHRMTDADDMHNNWVTDPEVCRFWTWEPHENMEETKAVLAEWIEDYRRIDTYHWIIVLKSISQAIGYIYLADIDNTNDSVSVHYALSQKYWNQGIMSEACKRVIDFAFGVLGAEKVHSHHHIENPASGRVMQKSGMRYVKTAYKELVPKHITGSERLSGKHCYYEIESSDWKRTQ
jgi:ribosomal-protein-alanine N-acetyltransferase